MAEKTLDVLAVGIVTKLISYDGRTVCVNMLCDDGAETQTKGFPVVAGWHPALDDRVRFYAVGKDFFCEPDGWKMEQSVNDRHKDAEAAKEERMAVPSPYPEPDGKKDNNAKTFPEDVPEEVYVPKDKRPSKKKNAAASAE